MCLPPRHLNRQSLTKKTSSPTNKRGEALWPDKHFLDPPLEKPSPKPALQSISSPSLPTPVIGSTTMSEPHPVQRQKPLPLLKAAHHPRTPTDCPQEALTRLQTEKRLTPYLRTTRANPTGHFWFTKIPAGRYYLVSLIDEGAGTRKEEQQTGLAWLAIELDAGEKLTNLVVTDCKASLC